MTEVFFFNTSGTMLFTRLDMEEGHWVQEEMQVTATFPYVAGKVIERGMRLGFRDPATDNIEVFEIRNVQNIEPDHYQQVIAEHIAIAELSDEHINSTEITDKTPTQVLTTALTGTQWSVGNVGPTNQSSCDIARGSVWQALQTIQTNWNVYCVPRVTVGASGITGKYIDIIATGGTFRGVRLAIRKNMSDSTVTYDDTDVLTALYGYGGSVEVAQSGNQDDKTEELTFKDQVWTATSGHPAKPSGQTYLEWPEKTAIYGRNGRPRYGFYQNGDIKDAAVLLSKTWEALQKTCNPKIEITGTCTELKRLGLADVPMRLHDVAVVDVEDTGEHFNKEIIKLDVDLVDPTATVPTIGDYIPNIIYINRETTEKATGGGGGGGRGQTNTEKNDSETYTMFIKTNNEIGMVVGRRSGDLYIKAGQIVLAINKSGETGEYESTAWINADHINIGAGQTVYTLAGDLYHDASGKLVIKDGVGLYAEHTVSGSVAKFGVFDDNTLTGGIVVTKINGQSGQTITRIAGDKIVIGNDSGIDSDYRGKTLDGTLTQITTDFTSVNTLLAKKIEATDINATTVQAAISNINLLSVNQLAASSAIGATGPISGSEIWSGGSRLKLIDASVSADGKTLTITRVTGGAINFNKGDESAAYNNGWNDCIDAATKVDRYTRSATGGGGAYGGNNYAHYISYQGSYKNVGTGWYKTSYDNAAYHIPAKKT